MAFRYRSDIVGKRFLAVKRGVKLKHKEYQNWDWQSGIIRASSDRDYLDPDVTILAEFTNQDWKRRQVVKIQDEYQLFLVEKTLVKYYKIESEEDEPFIQKHCGETGDISIALSFEAILGSAVFNKLPQVPIVTLLGLTLCFVKESSLNNHKEGEPCRAEERDLVQQWYKYQESQQLLLQTPTVLVGYRVRVYRAEGTTQWYTAVIQSYCEKTQELVVTDDTVLEEHREDPALLEIHLLGDRVIESILRGDDIRVRPSRTCRSQEKGNKPSIGVVSTTSLKRKSCSGKLEQSLDPVKKKGEKHVKRISLPNVQKNVDTENKRSSVVLGRTVSKGTKSQENFEVALRDKDNHTPTKSLIVPLHDISPKKFRDKKSTLWSPDKSDKFVLKSPSKLGEADVSVAESNCKRNSIIHSAKGKKCDTQSACSATSVKRSNKKSKELSSSATAKSSPSQVDLIPDQQLKSSTEKVDQSTGIISHLSVVVVQQENSKDTRTKPQIPEKSDPCRSSTTAAKKQKSEKNKNPLSSCSSSSTKKSSSCGNNKRPASVSGKEKRVPVESKSIDTASPLSSSPSPQYHNNKAVVRTDSSSCGKQEKKGPLIISEAPLITQECSRYKEKNQDLVTLLGSRESSGKHTEEELQKKSAECSEKNKTAGRSSSCISGSSTIACSSSSTLLHDSTKLHGIQAQKLNSSNSNKNIDSAAQVIEGKVLSGSSNKCIAKEIVASKTEGSCSGVDRLCEGKVNLHSQECLQSTASKRTTATTSSAVVVTSASSHGTITRNIPVFAETISEENKDMYYKKTLLGDYQRKESGGHASPEKGDSEKGNLSTTGINLNQSLTDQLARRNTGKPDQRRSWEDVMKSTSSNGLDLPPKVSDSNCTSVSVDIKVSPSVVSTVTERKADVRALEASYHHSSSVNTGDKSRSDELGQSKFASEPKAGPSSGHSSLPRDLRTDSDNRNKDSTSSQKSSNSPLLMDKGRPVEPYRDPELLKKDELLRIQAIQKQQGHVPLTHPSMNPPPNVPPALPGHPSTHAAAAHQILSQMNAAAAGGGVTPLSSQLAMQEQAVLNYYRSLALHQQTSLTPLTLPGIQNPVYTRTLEMLWQQKFPNIQVPPGWLLYQYQDELRRDVSQMTPNLLQHRDMLDREREIREREMALERERMDREMREREERERAAERERIERERQERERQERERQDRERREREERERLEVEKRERERQERERREKERQQEQQRERERREILHESKAAADAVEKHFQESLNRLNQQQRALSKGTWFPGGPNAKPSPLQSLSNPKSYPPGTSAFSSVSGAKPTHNTMPPTGGMERQIEEKPKLGEFPHGGHASHPGSSGRRSNRSPIDTKPKLSPQDLSQKPRSTEQDTKPAITLRESLIKGFPSEPVNLRTESKAFPGYPNYPPLKETTAAAVTATTSASGSSSSAGHQIKQEPNFSLYGYPYQQTNPMYISQDKLVQGLKEEKGIKQEPTDLRKTPLSSPPPLVKTEQKPVLGDSKPDIRPMAGHCHGSITLGTSRGQVLPQQDSKSGIMVASSSAASSSPMRVSSPQQLLQSMKSGQPGQVSSMKSHIPLSSAAQTTAALTMAMHQAYMVAMAQNSMGNMGQPQGSLLTNQNREKKPELSPNSQKRRAQQKESATSQDKKKTKVEPSGPPASTGLVTSATKPSGTYIDSFKSFVENAVQSAFLQEGDIGERIRLNAQYMQHLNLPPKPYDQPQVHRQQQHQQDTQKLSPGKDIVVSSSNASSTASSAGNNTLNTAISGLEDSRKQSSLQQQRQVSLVPQSQLPPTTNNTLSTVSTTVAQLSVGPPAKGVSSNPGIISHPGPVSTPGSASVSSISSIQETINRVANGTMDTDSDTLSAPSPPPALKSSSDAPSPVRMSNPSKPSFKKAILARYSGDTVVPQCENSNSSSVCDQSPPKIDKHEKMDTATTTVTTTTMSPVITANENAAEKMAETSNLPLKPNVTHPTLKTPLDLLKESEKDEMTTSASEAEQQDCDGKNQTGKGKKKTSKRKSEGLPAGSSSKKQKALATNNSDAESGSNTDIPNKRKKKNNSKNKSEDSDCNTKSKEPEVTQVKKDDPSNVAVPTVPNKTKPAKESARPPEDSNKGPSISSTGVSLASSSVSTVASSIGSGTSVLSSITSAALAMGKTPLMMEAERDLKKVKVEEKPVEVAKPKKSVWDCEKKLKEWEKKQTQKEKDGKKGKKGNGEKANSNKGETGQEKEASQEDNPSSILANKPLNKDPVNKLKKNQEPFLQDASCGEIAPKLMKCRECKMRNKKLPNIFCRFYAFRRLKYNPKGCLAIAGFSEPSDADVDDIELWYPRYPPISPKLDLEMAKYVMANLGDRFCELVEQEKEAMMWVSADSKIVWKRAVQGVREMCDVCDTTLFNMHWCCHKCGFVVCIDCYRNKAKKTGSNQDKSCKINEEATSNQKWLTCSANRQQHEPDKLKITQIIPSDVLWALGSMIHDVRDNWSMQSNCPCGHTSKVNQVIGKNGMVQHLFSTAVTQCMNTTGGELKDRPPLVNGIGTNNKKKTPLSNSLLESNALNGSPLMSPLNILAEAAATRESESKKEGGEAVTKETSSSGNNNQACSTLRDLLTRQGTAPAGVKLPGNQDNSKKPKGISGLGDILQEVVEKTHQKAEDGSIIRSSQVQGIKTLQMSHYKPRSGSQMQGRSSPIPMYTLKETSVLYPDITHSWLDHGRLLRLHDPRCPENIRLFQQQWRRGQPVIVSHCDKFLRSDIWTPKAFGKEFGELENDLVNCSTSVTMLGHKMRVFWDGFQKMGARLKDGKNRPLILKLKDWPPTEDFSDLMPSRFQDLMQALPLPEYTQRTGTFNLASRLPEFFVKPDLGPKMYNAYGSAMHPKTGSTNLHLDMSDAVNLMIYVGIPEDDKEAQEKAAMETMEEAGCCEFTKDRARTGGEKPGALWHIFDALDADKIRDLLNKVAVERGEKIDLNHDPIHDQAWYLNTELRERLLNEYGVQGYTIVQYLGDAVFIPAGAPHQVKNLHSCIKAAEDFVSPENINHCFKMTQEFRYLSETHSNHEDKLQIKNIIYHAVKDAVAVLKQNDPTAENPVVN